MNWQQKSDKLTSDSDQTHSAGNSSGLVPEHDPLENSVAALTMLDK